MTKEDFILMHVSNKVAGLQIISGGGFKEKIPTYQNRFIEEAVREAELIWNTLPLRFTMEVKKNDGVVYRNESDRPQY